ncbi:hypothetical protein EV363DRAFT_1403242 [Boletus edulis]|nr:hypothetical protein EV363DRAFT_1403242 [Boletus edulis]
MPDHLASLSSQSQQADPPADIQHGVIVNRLWLIKMVGDSPTTELTFHFFNGTEKQKEAGKWDGDGGSGLDPISGSESESEEPPTKKKRRSGRNPFDFKTWQDCANVGFIEIQDKMANIRITFQGTSSATKRNEPTMTLAGLADRHPPSKEHRGSILHEFGHALGLYHEHQGPHAGLLLKLNKEAVNSCLGADTATRNILKIASKDNPDIWNYTNFDRKSIMTYHLPRKWQLQEKVIRIKGSRKLSKYDQGCIRLMYLPDLRIPKNENRFRKALTTLHVDETVAGNMIADFTRDPKKEVNVRLTRLRNQFNQWKEGVLLYKRK